MTNNEDVRPGNQVLMNAEGSPVTIVEVEQKSVFLEGFPGNIHRSKEHIYGILLTTDMLRNFNFNDDKTSDSWCGQGITLHLKEDGAFYGLRLLRNRAKIQYLHQLQNYITDFHIAFKDQTNSFPFANNCLLQNTCI